MRTVFGNFGGCEIDSDLLVREGQTSVDNCRSDAFSGFADGFVSHTNDIEGWQAFAGIALNFYKLTFVSVGNGRINFCYHVDSVIVFLTKQQA